MSKDTEIKEEEQLSAFLSEVPETVDSDMVRLNDGLFRELADALPEELSDATEEDTIPSCGPLSKKERKELARLREIKLTLRRMLLQMILPAGLLMWDELIFHIYVNKGVHDSSVWYIALFAAAFGFLYAIPTGLLRDKAAKRVNTVFVFLVTFWFIIQTFYQKIFNNYLTVSVMGNAGDAKEFWKEGVRSLWSRAPLVILLLLPIVFWVVLRKLGFRHGSVGKKWFVVPALGVMITMSVAFFFLNGAKARESGRRDIFFKEWQSDRGVRENGILVGLCQDLYRSATYHPDDIGEVVIDAELPEIPTLVPPTPEQNRPVTPEPTVAPNHTPTPTPTPIDRSPHTLNIDFASLAANERNTAIRTIHEYMASTTPVNKNEYTGMFKGYNVVMLTCETFSPLAVSRELTPTLYKLVHSGFYFDNFYTPYWITSTSDGEYTACTGLLPDTQKSGSFSRSSKNKMSCCLGHIFHGMGYATYAFHNHDADYYDRNKSHPNMGYTFIAKYRGLKVTDQFPESDVEMMQLSIPMYINEDHFLAYYMTMSGHMSYNWDNAMAKKHKNEVSKLPYSDEAKCYIAGNIELENAVRYLIDELEKAGKLENTLIVLSGDHYAYGLPEEARNEIAGHKIEEEFELYKNHLVIWNPKIEQQTIHKAACSLDIMPTVLNLLGIEYDSRLYMGTDIFSDSLGLVQFKDNSFITDYVRYNANNGKALWLNGAEDWDDDTQKKYIDSYKTIVRNKFNISRAMLNNDYYATVDSYLWWKHPEQGIPESMK